MSDPWASQHQHAYTPPAEPEPAEQLQTPQQPDEPAGQPIRRIRGQVLAGVAGGILVFAGIVGLVLGGTLADRDAGTSSSAPPASTPQSSVLGQTPGLPLDEEAACLVLVPVLNDAVDLLTLAAQPDGKAAVHAQRARLDATIASLKTYVRRVPANMRPDVQVELDTLLQVEELRMGNAPRIRSQEAAASGIALATLCRKYAVG